MLLLSLWLTWLSVPVTADLAGELVHQRDDSILVLVPAGSFLMGSHTGSLDQRPARQVALPAYYIGKHEVSNRQFRQFLQATGTPAPESWARAADRWGERAPALYLSYFDARAYCDWAGLRLPDEAEWERAARGTDGRRFPWGNAFELTRCQCAAEGPAAVDAHPEGASPSGCLNMAGNAWEWTDSWYDAYPGSSWRCDEFGKKFRVLRGGCWQHRSPDFLESCQRSYNLAASRLEPSGFRVARDP